MGFVQVSTADGQKMQAFEVLATNKDAPGLVLIQEIFGVNASMRQLAQDWAERGFNVWCPDLFFRSEPGLELSPTNQSQLDLGLELMQEMDNELTLGDLESTRAQLAQKLGHENIVAVGYCMGGRLVVEFAQKSPIKAAVSYYGVNLENVLPPLGQAAPTMLHIAELDKWVQGDARGVIEAEAAKRTGWESHVYAGCDHAFARPKGMHFDADADRLAIERSMAFFTRHC
ncbi:dienelactone hydrolase family protein [Paenalcaligenes faecalis]|uniref:dienelactone hydrolase family protein n=1 Tax=Paenalcaligenes faecalis TaxID=2980099 RepID=UPI0022B9815A|nr:dienelactone hydrolase family protein [Paenalcaligenes faecalis]